MDQQRRQRTFHLRTATVNDIPFTPSLTPRFAQVGTPAWRNPEQIWQFHQDCIHEVGAAILNPDDLVLIAEDLQDGPLGFLHVTSVADFFTSEQAEGKGIAHALTELEMHFTNCLTPPIYRAFIFMI
jgi:hypothetical protein